MLGRVEKAAESIVCIQPWRLLDQFLMVTMELFCIVGPDGCIRRVNSVFKSVLGYAEGDIPTIRLQDLVHPEDKKAFLEAVKRLRGGSPVTGLETRFRHADGSFKWLAWKAIVDDGLIYAAAYDITEQVRMRQEMMHLDRLHVVGELAAGIAHEVRNPMTSARGFIQLLAEKNECRPYRHYFTLIAEELDRASQMISQFLSLVKNRPTERSWCNLNHIVEKLLPLIEADAIKAGVTVCHEQGLLPDLLLDEREIRQMILNLTRNALDAMNGKGLITIRTFQKEGQTVLSVADQGPGIPSGILNKLGKPFLTTKEQGTGLGLASCFGIAQRHNATIDVDTGPKGTTFSVCFTCPSPA